MLRLLMELLVCCQGLQSPQEDPGNFARALWFLQSHGDIACCSPGQDRVLKSALAADFSGDQRVQPGELEGMLDPQVMKKFAGDDNILSAEEIHAAVEAAIPASRLSLFPELRQHAELLTTSFDMIDSRHYQAIDQLAAWIAANHRPDQTLHLLAACTGNSRRSILTAQMGNLAAAWYGFENVRFHSAGTIPSAFNPRTVRTLQQIGFRIEPTGKQLAGLESRTPNPEYRVAWGEQMEMLEFSKTLQDPSNPSRDFAAIMVCAEADSECPMVSGAALRVSMTFLDPKWFDDGEFEPAKYAERRDDIGRTMLAVMAKARRLSEKPVEKPAE